MKTADVAINLVVLLLLTRPGLPFGVTFRAPSAQYDASLVAPSGQSAARSGSRPLFQKRVRQIHKASADSRRVHNDETLPWVLEDFETGNNWESSRTQRKDGLAAMARHFQEGGRGLPTPDESSTAGIKPEEQSEDKKPNVADAKLVQHAPWVGKLEGNDLAHETSSSSSAQVLFVFDERNQGGFKVVPVRKSYRFMQKSRFANEMGDEEREKEYARLQKSRDLAPSRFGSRTGSGDGTSAGLSSRGRNYTGGASGFGGGLAVPGLGLNGHGPGAGGSRIKKEEDISEDWPELRGLSLNSMPSSRPRGLVAVSGGSRGSSRRGFGGGDDDDEGAFHRRGDDEGGTYDELDYQEDFADDEERMGGEAELAEDNDAREMEERLKREMAKAGVSAQDENEQGGAHMDDKPDDDLFGDEGSRRGRRGREDDQLTGSGRQMKKIMTALAKREGGLFEEYESDDEVNPYASEEEDDEEEPAIANPEEAMRRAREEKEREEKEARANNPLASSTSSLTGSRSGAPSEQPSRGATPAPSSGGNASKGTSTPSKRPQVSKGRPSQGNLNRMGSGHKDFAKRAASSSTSRGVSPAASRSPSPGPTGSGAHAPRQSSPLANEGSQATAAGIKRPASPSRETTGGSVASSQGGGNVGSSSRSFERSASSSEMGNKRARTETGTSGSARPSRPSSPSSPAPGAGGGAVSPLEAELIHLVRTGAVKNIGEVIGRFKKRLQAQPGLKGEMTEAFKRVLTGGTRGLALTVKPGF